MPDVPIFEAVRFLASRSKNGAVVEVIEGKDGTYLILFTAPGQTGKTAVRVSRPTFDALLDVGFQMLGVDA